MAQHVQWGTITLYLDNEAFRVAFRQHEAGFPTAFQGKTAFHRKNRSVLRTF